MLFALLDQTTLFGAVAAFSTLVGIALAILSHFETRKSAAEEASKKCHEDLLAEQRRTEKLSKELQELRLKYGESDDQ